MSPLKRGTVIDVNLDPTKGSETGRIRPCIIVTNDTYNERVPVIQVVPVTAWSVKAGDYFDVLPERGRPRYILVSDFQTFELQTPTLGEHNREILPQWLGYAPEQVQELERKQILRNGPA